MFGVAVFSPGVVCVGGGMANVAKKGIPLTDRPDRRRTGLFAGPPQVSRAPYFQWTF